MRYFLTAPITGKVIVANLTPNGSVEVDQLLYKIDDLIGTVEEVRSPINGSVDIMSVRHGDFVHPNQELAVLTD